MAIVETTIEKDNTIICVNVQLLPGNTIAPDLTMNKEYPAQEVYECKCGQKHIDVGLKSQHNWITCYNCREELPNGDTIHWCHPSRFEVKA
jgi:hypothetical protein